MVEKLLIELVRKAHVEQSVSCASISGGMQILVYPLDRGVLIGIGREGERAQAIDATRLLHRRAGNMARFGSWLPARLKDGAWYVVKRVLMYDLDISPLSQSDLETAEELLS